MPYTPPILRSQKRRCLLAFFVIFAVSLGGGNKGVTSTLLLFRRYHFNIALANGLGLTIPVGQ